MKRRRRRRRGRSSNLTLIACGVAKFVGLVSEAVAGNCTFAARNAVYGSVEACAL
jgi:hypothetical protein